MLKWNYNYFHLDLAVFLNPYSVTNITMNFQRCFTYIYNLYWYWIYIIFISNEGPTPNYIKRCARYYSCIILTTDAE